jgi:acetate kinase
MDTILVINAGSSSVKFRVFETGSAQRLSRKIKGEVEAYAGLDIRRPAKSAADRATAQ